MMIASIVRTGRRARVLRKEAPLCYRELNSTGADSRCSHTATATTTVKSNAKITLAVHETPLLAPHGGLASA